MASWTRTTSGLVPRDEAEEAYAKQFVNNGNPAHPARIALGALIIKQELQCSDEWTVRHVSENPYLQYCLGLKEYTSKCPFGASTTVELRKRFPFLLCWQLPPPSRCNKSGNCNPDCHSNEAKNTLCRNRSSRYFRIEMIRCVPLIQ